MEVPLAYTDSQLSDFKAEFARRELVQYVVGALGLAAVVALFVVSHRTPSLIGDVDVRHATVAVLGTAYGLTYWNWRCPACRTYLGRRVRMKHCPNCGVALR